MSNQGHPKCRHTKRTQTETPSCRETTILPGCNVLKAREGTRPGRVTGGKAIRRRQLGFYNPNEKRVLRTRRIHVERRQGLCARHWQQKGLLLHFMRPAPFARRLFLVFVLLESRPLFKETSQLAATAIQNRFSPERYICGVHAACTHHQAASL